MKRNYTFIPLLLLLIVAIVACSNNSSKSAADNDSEGDATKATVQVPQFSADSAYQYIQTQADFGPRVPNTAAHKACGEFLAKKLEEFREKNAMNLAIDAAGALVYLAPSRVNLQLAQERAPAVDFLATREHAQVALG